MVIILPGDKGRMDHINYIQVWLFTRLEFRIYTSKHKDDFALISTIWLWKCVDFQSYLNFISLSKLKPLSQ